MTTSTLAGIDWPLETDFEYQSVGKWPNSFRGYKHVSGWWRPGVTSILDPWDKKGLIKWAADQERLACMEATGTAWEDYRKTTAIDLLTGPEFSGQVEQRLGKARSHQKQMEKAGDIGTFAHQWVQWRLKSQMGVPAGVEPVIPEASMLAAMAWEDHWKSAEITPLRVEQWLWSEKHDFAGTVDLFGIRDGKLGIVDLKTSKYTYGSHHLQVAAYALAAEELFGVEVEWAELWRMPKTLEDIRFEVVPLGKLYDRTVSREDLTASFIGLRQAWETLMRPKEGM